MKWREKDEEQLRGRTDDKMMKAEKSMGGAEQGNEVKEGGVE